jgi:two-component system, chemotaxis family, chemotaxis protein CheY
MAYNVLVVDDSATVRAMIRKTLTMSSLPLNEIYLAGNGREALALLAEHWMDLVLTDINMPEMDGMELVRRMSEDAVLRSIPVVVVSTEGSESRIEELRGHGIRGYLRKPFTPEAIKEIVDGILGGRDGG